DPGEPGQPGPAVPGEAAGQYEAGRDQTQEADATEGEVQHAVPADGGGLGGTGGEALRGIGAKDARPDQARPVDAHQDRGPGAAPAGRQGPAETDRSGHGHQPGDDEVRDLDPAVVAVGQQAPGVPGRV